MIIKPVSKCCQARLVTHEGDEGTNSFHCHSCGKPCDMMIPEAPSYPQDPAILVIKEECSKLFKELEIHRSIARDEYLKAKTALGKMGENLDLVNGTIEILANALKRLEGQALQPNWDAINKK